MANAEQIWNFTAPRDSSGQLTNPLDNHIANDGPWRIMVAAYTTDGGAFHNVGIGTKDKPEAEVDVGRAKVSKSDADWSAFKTPTLRNVTRSAPYFHDGSVSTLEEAVTIMAGGGIPNKHKDAKLVDKKLKKDEIASIVSFLGALECKGVLARR